MMPGGREVGELQAACKNVNAALSGLAAQGSQVPDLLPGSGPRPDCLLENVELQLAGAAASLEPVLKSTRDAVIGIWAAILYANSGLDWVAWWGHSAIFLFSSALFAAVFAWISVWTRAQQLRENEFLPEVAAAYRPGADYEHWLTKPLSEGVLQGVTPIEAAAYQSTRRDLLQLLGVSGVAARPAVRRKPKASGPGRLLRNHRKRSLPR